MTARKTFGFMLAACTAILVSGGVKPAEAADYVCDGGIDYVDFEQMSSTNIRLQVGCRSGGTVRHLYAYTGSSTCTSYNRTVETLKGFKTTAEAALLSGRRLQIYYGTCSSTNYIATVSLRGN